MPRPRDADLIQQLPGVVLVPASGCNLSEPAAHWTAMAAGVRAAQPSKPFVISETVPAALGVEPNARTRDTVQTEVIERDDVALADATISGLTPGTFSTSRARRRAGQLRPCDYEKGVSPPVCAYYNVTKCGGFRPGGINHKGVVDFWRREKEAYGVVAAKYKAAQRASVEAAA